MACDFIDRSVVLLKPKKNFLQWVKKLPDAAEGLTLEELRKEAKAVLIPDFDGFSEVQECIGKHAVSLFEMELSDWCPDRKTWPPKRDVANFLEWFDLEYHSTVIELDEDNA